jgi:hypothetical protein
VTALLYERTGVDEVEDWGECVAELDRDCILWIDLDSPEPEEIDRLVETSD